MREWKTLFVEGQPLYETPPMEIEEIPEEPTAEQLLQEEALALLDEGDLKEFRVRISLLGKVLNLLSVNFENFIIM